MENVQAFLEAALECSIFVSPREIGLTWQELLEIGQQAGYRQGEINDALGYVGEPTFGSKYIRPASPHRSWLVIFNPAEDPDYRNIFAFDFAVKELHNLERSVGQASARIERDVMVQRAVTAGIAANEMEAAIACLLLAETLIEQNGVLQFKFRNAFGAGQLFSKQLEGGSGRSRIPKPHRAKAYPIVKDVIGRRTDGRAASAEPLTAFAEQLAKIGYPHFRLWWTRIVAEMKISEASASPVAICVLAAALVEGSITFAARFARDKGLSYFQSNDFGGAPSSWRLDKLIGSAASCGILDGPAKSRAEALNTCRQRIHAGRMLTDYPTGVPDIRPEEARDAKATADLVARRVCDWLDQHRNVMA